MPFPDSSPAGGLVGLKVSLALTLILLCGRAVAEVSLTEFLDAKLQTRLEQEFKANKVWSSLQRDKRIAVCLMDMRGDTPKLASINGDHMMYAASLPKIAIMFAAYASFEDGSLQETPEVRKDLADMIRVSSNSAATRMIDRLGFAKIQRVLQDPKYHFYEKDNGGGLWVGKRYASKGKRIGDPLYNISHGATAHQVCRFFYLIATRQLINEHRSEQMLEDLGDPGLNHKFVSQTNIRAPKADVYRKSGSWRQYHADAILVKGVRWRDYVLVAMVERHNGEQIIRNLLPAAERAMNAAVANETPKQSGNSKPEGE